MMFWYDEWLLCQGFFASCILEIHWQSQCVWMIWKESFSFFIVLSNDGREMLFQGSRFFEIHISIILRNLFCQVDHSWFTLDTLENIEFQSLSLSRSHDKSKRSRALMFPTPCAFCLWWDGEGVVLKGKLAGCTVCIGLEQGTVDNWVCSKLQIMGKGSGTRAGKVS